MLLGFCYGHLVQTFMKATLHISVIQKGVVFHWSISSKMCWVFSEIQLDKLVMWYIWQWGIYLHPGMSNIMIQQNRDIQNFWAIIYKNESLSSWNTHYTDYIDSMSFAMDYLFIKVLTSTQMYHVFPWTFMCQHWFSESLGNSTTQCWTQWSGRHNTSMTRLKI